MSGTPSAVSKDVESYRQFLRRLPLMLIVAMLLWMVLRPVLDLGVSRFAETLVRAFEYPRVTRLVADDHVAREVLRDPARRQGSDGPPS